MPYGTQGRECSAVQNIVCGMTRASKHTGRTAFALTFCTHQLCVGEDPKPDATAKPECKSRLLHSRAAEGWLPAALQDAEAF